MKRLSNAASLFCLLACPLASQEVVESVDFKRPEAWAMRYFASASLMQGTSPPRELDKGQFSLGFDVANIPRLNKTERTVGFYGTKEENLNKAPVIARPLLHYGITGKLSLTASYVPPVEVFDRLETHMAGLYFNYELLERDRLRVGLRAGGQWSEATGDFTCAEEISGIMDPEINPFGCIEPSNDTFTSLSATVELTAEYRPKPGLPFDLILSVAYTYADLEFEVDALWGGGFEDQRLLLTEGDIWSCGAGMKYAFNERIHATLMLIHVPLDLKRLPDAPTTSSTLTHFRLGVHLLL